MNFTTTQEFVEICETIVSHGKSIEAWAELESDDMFQSKNFIGGFDATEMAFCFSYYDPTGQEYWFQLTLSEIEDIARGRTKSIEARPAGQ